MYLNEDIILSLISGALDAHPGVRIAVGIDGRCGAGKSTLAARLAAHFDAPTVHMDDFFLPNDLRTEARRREAGGNVHYERFLSEVAPFLHGCTAFSYGKFDCGERCITAQIAIPAHPLVLVEGAYALHPLLSHLYAVRIFMTVGAQEQKRRIRSRNGAAMLERFVTEWIPLEEQYISAFQIPAKCDIVIDGGTDTIG